LPLSTLGGASHNSEAVPAVLLALTLVLLGAKLFGELVERLGQPAVLGELVFGKVVEIGSGLYRFAYAIGR